MISKGGQQGLELISIGALRRQLFYTSLLCLLTFVMARLMPGFPFPAGFGWLCLVSSASYLAAGAVVNRMGRERYFLMLSVMTALSLAILGGMVHFTGGITSPFIFFYFAIMLSEAAYGVENYSTIFMGIASYLLVTLGEAFGLFPSYSASSDLIYADKWVVLWLTLSTASIMLVTGFVGRIVMAGYRATAERESHKVRALAAEVGELESYSQIGMVAHRIVHDIRTPLATALGYLELKERDKVPAGEDEGLLKEVRGSLEDISAMLADINRYGRRAEAKREKICLASFLNTMLTLMVFYPGAKGIKFHREFQEGEELCTAASLRELRQVYFNLLKNAVEAVSAVSAREITVGLRRDGEWAEISVADSGPGVPPAARGSLFRESYTSKEKGTGVGLLITRDLLTRNGGDIEYREKGGSGAEFVTRLPLFVEK
jgi:signal transduction histidine kinase